MTDLQWIVERPPSWDEAKAEIVGSEPGAFAPELLDRPLGARVPGDWWRVERDGQVVGYGWMDVVWGEAEILLATRPGARGQGVGTFILDRLEGEARARGLNYLTNVVREGHPRKEEISRWLQARGFRPGGEGSLRRAVAPSPAAG